VSLKRALREPYESLKSRLLAKPVAGALKALLRLSSGSFKALLRLS
jgi:hypothetical protein